MKNTALLIIDMQNDNITAGGANEGSGSVQHAKQQNLIENVQSIVQKARKVEMPIIHSHFVVEKGAPTLKKNAPIFEGIKEGGSVQRGSWGVKAVEGVQPQQGDYIVERDRVSAFKDTPLDTYLRGLDIQRIIVVGVWTNMAVEHTCRDGADYGYEVTIVTDATSSMNQEWHEASLNTGLTNVTTQINTKELLKTFF